MQEEQQQNTDPLGWAVFVTDIWARSLQLPMRHTVGKEYIDVRGVLALLLALFWGGLGNALPVLAWSGVYLLSCFLHRVGTLRRYLKGTVLHSRYNGYPWLGTLTRHRFHETSVKTILEPLVAVVIAVLVAPFGDAAFLYFFGGAVCMVASTKFLAMQEQRMLDDLNNAAMESQFLMSRFHKRR